jgi:hypothetical protein
MGSSMADTLHPDHGGARPPAPHTKAASPHLTLPGFGGRWAAPPLRLSALAGVSVAPAQSCVFHLMDCFFLSFLKYKHFHM